MRKKLITNLVALFGFVFAPQANANFTLQDMYLDLTPSKYQAAQEKHMDDVVQPHYGDAPDTADCTDVFLKSKQGAKNPGGCSAAFYEGEIGSVCESPVVLIENYTGYAAASGQCTEYDDPALMAAHLAKNNDMTHKNTKDPWNKRIVNCDQYMKDRGYLGGKCVHVENHCLNLLDQSEIETIAANVGKHQHSKQDSARCEPIGFYEERIPNHYRDTWVISP